jgi:hypothetical protein
MMKQTQIASKQGRLLVSGQSTNGMKSFRDRGCKMLMLT